MGHAFRQLRAIVEVPLVRDLPAYEPSFHVYGRIALVRVRVRCYLHDDSHASQQGWYRPGERVLELGKPFRSLGAH
jgi:hypothetical protein